MPCTKLWLMGAAAGGSSPVGWMDAAVGRPLPRWWESCGDVAAPLGSCPCLQALRALPSAIPGTPRGSLSGEGAQLRSLKQTDSSAARVAHGYSCSLCSALLLQLFDFYRKCVQRDLSLQLPPGWLCRASLWGFSFPHYTQQWESLGALPGFLPLFHPSG